MVFFFERKKSFAEVDHQIGLPSADNYILGDLPLTEQDNIHNPFKAVFIKQKTTFKVFLYQDIRTICRKKYC